MDNKLNKKQEKRFEDADTNPATAYELGRHDEKLLEKAGKWEIDGEIHVRRKGEKYFTEVDGNEFLNKLK